MASESETPRITELHVRMDCNGCEHKIRKTLRAIDGVSDVYVDFANQKVTVVGIADPERIVKAIRKTKRVPTIFSHTDPAAPPPPAAEGEAPPPPPEEAAPAAEPAPEESKEAPPPEEAAPAATDATVIHMVHDYPYSSHVDNHHHMFRDHWPAASHPAGGMVGYGGAPYYATHSYSHRPSPYLSEYGYVGSPAHEGRSYYSSHDYYHYPAAAAARGKGDGSQITSMFSDENPNACAIA